MKSFRSPLIRGTGPGFRVLLALAVGACASEDPEEGCAPGFDEIGGECLDSRMVDCNEAPPRGAVAIVRKVEITFDGQAWSEPEDCDWECGVFYDLVGGRCIDTQEVDCLDTAPDNATSTPGKVEITFDGVAWTTPAPCDWTCDAGFDLVDGACVDTQSVDCRAAPPANGTAIVEKVEITFDGTRWSDPATCAWTCDAGYDRIGSACLNEREVACDDTPPPNATIVDPTERVVVTFDGTRWSDPATCPWTCEDAYDLVDDECTDVQLVLCTDAPPANATSVLTPVEIRYDGSSWSSPAVCPWTCDDGYRRDGDGCKAEVEECEDDHHGTVDADGRDTCVPNVNIENCHMDPHDVHVRTREEFEMNAWPETDGEVGEAGIIGVTARWCYVTADVLSADEVSYEAFDCSRELRYDPDYDAYRGTLFLEKSGTYEYVVAFSGDGGARWALCGRGGRMEPGAYEPGHAHVEE